MSMPPAPAPNLRPRIQANFAQARPRETREVWLYDNFYAPFTTQVKPGTQVRWVNKGHHYHTVTSSAGLWDSGAFLHGAEYSLTFTRPGQFDYYCRFHPREMSGRVVVAE
jgi:plastocyanin